MPKCKSARIGPPSPKARQQGIHQHFIAFPSGDHGRIGVHGQPWLAPALHGDAADEAVGQAGLIEGPAEFKRGGDDALDAHDSA